MHILPAKDSIYAIQPWNEQPATLPSSFLRAHPFAKTAFLPTASLKHHKQLQIANNSVYLIKNLQDNDPSSYKQKPRFHYTAQNSPRIAPQDPQKNTFRRGLSERLTKSHQMLKTYKKQATDEDALHTKFQQTKQTFIEFKLIKRTRRPSLAETDSKNAEGKSNLQKKYERSTQAKNTKQIERKQEDISEQIFIRRKLKTEKSSLQSVKNLLAHTEDPQKQLISPLKPNATAVKESASWKEEGAGVEKLKFQLLMQRKLFLMKNNLNKWHRNSENNSATANRASK